MAYQRLVTNCSDVERGLHERLAPARVNGNREFFAVSPTVAIDILHGICAEHLIVTGSEALVAEPPRLVEEPIGTTAQRRSAVHSRRSERLGPVIAHLGRLIRRLEKWRSVLPKIRQYMGEHIGESRDFSWHDLEKAARAASTVSLAAHDTLSEMERPLREAAVACQDLQERVWNRRCFWDADTEQSVKYHVKNTREAINAVLPALRSVHAELSAFVPELMRDSGAGA